MEKPYKYTLTNAKNKSLRVLAKIRKVPTSETKFQYHFVCLGCDQEHAFNDEIWKWNHDFDKPTLSPSYLMQGDRFDKNGNSVPFLCHSFIKEGEIQYLNDCTHHLKGQTVELPECVG